MNDTQKEIFSLARSVHEDVYLLLKDDESACKSLTDLADKVYAMREAESLLEDAAKEVRKSKQTTERMFCMLWLQVYATEAKLPDNLKTDYCTATPNMELAPKIPSMRGEPEQYQRMMRDLGVTSDHGAVRPHWPALVEHCKELLKQGKPLPGDLDIEETYPVYSVRVRKRADIA